MKVKVCVLLSQPRCLFSSTSVLQTQRATCFEFATLLCSLLLGNNYDAYCVSGYAVKEMCLLDQSWQECPLLDTEVKVGAAYRPSTRCSQTDLYLMNVSVFLCFMFVYPEREVRAGAAGE